MSVQQPLAYTLERAVEVCGGIITLHYLQQAVRRGMVAHVRIGRNIGITPQQLREFIDAHKVTPAAPAGSSTSSTDPDAEPAPALPQLTLTSMSSRSRAHHARKQATS